MARKCKTPEKLIKLIDRHWEQMERIEEILRVKRTVPVENQANHITEKSEDYWIGLAHGHSNMLETALFEANCYAGFHHESVVRRVECEDGSAWVGRQWDSDKQPGYEAWRVKYHAR